MTIKDAIEQAGVLENNHYSIKTKSGWLSDLDKRIFAEIIQTHDRAAVEEFDGYDNATPDTELLVHDAYSQLYVWYLVGKIQIANGDIDRYSNTQILFDAAYKAYEAWYNRTHMPNGPHRFVY